MELGGRMATYIQQLGTNVQSTARNELGAKSLLTAFIVGLTMGMVWVPCAGPALGFALTLVRDEPGIRAFLYLTAYGIGAGLPLLAIGYGGQYAVHSVRALSRYSGRIKQVSGIILIISALLFRFDAFQKIQTWLLENTSFGNIGVDIESSLFADDMPTQNVTGVAPNKTTKLPIIGKAPELTGLGTWHNSNPLTSADLKGKVVLIDFWTYSCINCIRTLPYIQGYWEKFKDTPFVLIGVHTPEFVFEKSENNVASAIKKHGLTYPVSQDNDYATWRAFDNHYWPAKYLIDAEGNVRYIHFGEGEYEETDQAISSLLAEIGVTVEGTTVQEERQAGTRRERSPETYLGNRSWDQLANKQGNPSDLVISYAEPCTPRKNQFCLIGDWQLIDGEQQLLKSDTGEIRMKFIGSEANLVFGLEEGMSSAQVDVYIDGVKTKTITIAENDLQNLFDGDYGEHDLIIKIKGAGVSAYAFTFGA
jgi:thiol-disulfide isomerase/thioredoxin